MSDAAAHATITLAQDKGLFGAPNRSAAKRNARAGAHGTELKVPRGLR
jgi:hypothetical protein